MSALPQLLPEVTPSERLPMWRAAAAAVWMLSAGSSTGAVGVDEVAAFISVSPDIAFRALARAERERLVVCADDVWRVA